MKPKNFPARKLARQINAAEGALASKLDKHKPALEAARNIRTKKDRSGSFKR